MKNTALITGASGGIGEHLARIHASKSGDLILVARSGDQLKALKRELEEKHGIKVLVIAKDLSESKAPKDIYDQLEEKGIEIEYLINNAGFGDFKLFAESDWTKLETMIHLNVRALTELTHLFVPGMIARKSGRVLNLGSIASFLPGPMMAVYHATKSYVLSFSEAIAEELSGTGVTVTALCPGVTESGFQKGAGMENSGMIKGKKLPTAEEVAEFGYKKMMRGERIAVHGSMNKIISKASRILPSRLLTKATFKAQQERGDGH